MFMLPFSRHALRLFYQGSTRNAPLALRWASTTASPTKVASQAPALAPVAAPQINLREYQEDCIQAVLAFLQKGHKRLGISLATGGGKTVIFTHLIDRVPAIGDATQTLILAHRRELVEQAAKHCINTYPQKTVEVELGKHHSSGAADITVASIQSITSGDRLAKFNPSRFKLILVDEAHHIVSPTYLELTEHFGLRHVQDWTKTSVPALVGVSATFSRFDGRKLGAVIDHLVYHRYYHSEKSHSVFDADMLSDYIEMIEENWLSDVIFTTVQTEADLRKVQSGTNGDFQTSALSQAINTNKTNELVVKCWLARAQGRQSTLVFCVDINHVMSLTAKFREFGVRAEFVTGITPAVERAARVDAFRKGEFPVLLNCSVFTEGTDIPNIDCILLARPTKSRNLLVQMIGRGMRLHKGKENCHIIDLVSSLSTGLISTPTLFGLDPAELVEEATHKDMKDLQEKKKEKQKLREQQAVEVQKKAAARRIPGTITFTDYSSVHELIADASIDHNIRRYSQNAWVAIGDGMFVLHPQSGNYLLIEPSHIVGEFLVKFYRRIPSFAKSKSPYATPKVIAEAESFEHAVHAADAYAAEAFERIWIARTAGWRRGPASAAQLNLLNKFRKKHEELTSKTLTRGRAADMITRIKHGAMGRWDRAHRRKRADDRRQASEQSSRAKLGLEGPEMPVFNPL